jgi:hypothetical protein
MQPPGWTKTKAGTHGKCGAEWRHSSGWTVAHCGHPTALWPFYLIPPGHDDGGPAPIVVAPNGRGFQHLAAAMRAVELRTNGARGVIPSDDSEVPPLFAQQKATLN